ncbi:glycosyltransferase [Kordiimonas aestuarii]|uniref:glycosyltransferase n=1 Tax=Kordiimonas aestuarii TaxID=1005925 RepID=UPI002943DE00|nr:glycosyltransferase [Kordiimonas aestuarii]
MTSAVKLENAFFVTQESLLLVGWCVNDEDDELVLRINGEAYVTLTPNHHRPDVDAHFARVLDDHAGIRRTVLLQAEHCAADSLEVELALVRGDEDIHTDKIRIDVANAKKVHRITGDFDENTERLDSRYCWPDNLEPGLTSVILGVYNGEKYLPMAIESILDQTDKNIQLIIVDDASTDGTRDILLEFKERDPRIELVLKDQNAGQGQAFNTGILRARGDLTCIMDADDFWFPRKVEVVRKVFDQHKAGGEYALFQHRLNVCYGTVVSQEQFRASLLEGDILNHCRKEKNRIPGPFIPTAGLAFPTEILRVVFPIPRAFRICADGFLTRAAISFGQGKAITETLGAYRIHSENNTVGNEAFEQERYIADILIPEVNRFYEKNNIFLHLPIDYRAKRSVALNRVVPKHTSKGIYYASERKRYAHGLEDFRNIHKGKRAFIVATGPSLKISDLDFLKDEITFACNKITLAFDETDWRPTYYSIIDSLVYENLVVDWSSLPSVNFFPEDLRRKYAGLSNTFFVKNRTPIYNGENRVFEFSENVSEGAAGGYTVVYFMMQLAFHMGIEELYLIGLDFSFNFKALSDEKTVKGEAVIINSDEVNHFHKGYRPEGEKWTMPRLDLQQAAFTKAKHAFERAGRKIYNASRATKLDVFERVDFDALMQEKADKRQNEHMVGDVYGDIMLASYSSTFEEIRVQGWCTPRPERIDVFHEGTVVCCGEPVLESYENASLASGAGIYVWSAAGEAPIKTGDSVRVVMRFADGSRSVVTCPVATHTADIDMKHAFKELLLRNRQLQKQLDEVSSSEANT